MKRAIPRLALGMGVAALAACGGSESAMGPTSVPSPATRPQPAPVARYQVTFDATWSAASHPNDVPRTPHFSPLVGGTHRSTVRFWEAGGYASDGIRLMAERGRTSPLDTEVQAAITTGHAQHVLLGGDIDVSPGQASLEFDVSREYPLVTLVSMLAPSPDWFVGVSGLDLLASGDWVQQTVIVLQPWDAGTDSGETFTAPDLVTQPREPIQRITTGPLVVGASVPPVGTFTFRRLS